MLDKTTTPPTVIAIDAPVPSQVRIFDPFDTKRKIKVIKNIVSYTPTERNTPNGIEFYDVPQYGKMDFSRGCLSVNCDEPLKLGMMMYADNNVSKPDALKRNHDVSALYWEEDNSSLYIKDYRQETNNIKLLALALNSANASTLDRMKAILYQVSEKPGHPSPNFTNADTIEHDFFHFVQTNPREYILMDVDDRAKIQVKVIDATARGLLIIDRSANKYKLALGGDKKRDLFAYKPTDEGDTQKALLDYLSSESGEKALADLTYHMTPREHPYEPEKEVGAKKELASVN